MLRCGQMLATNAMKTLLGGFGTVCANGVHSVGDVQDLDDASIAYVFRPAQDDLDAVQQYCVDLIADVPLAPASNKGLFGIHALVDAGLAAGRWHGPSAVAIAISGLIDAVRPRGLASLVVPDMTVYVPAVRDRVLSGPLLVWLVLRLGASGIPAEMRDVPGALVTAPHSVGVIGGERGHALYFYGVAPHGDFGDDLLLYLDPHAVQAASSGADSYICGVVHTIRAVLLDPCMAAGFLLRDQSDLSEWLAWLHSAPYISVSHSYAHEDAQRFAVSTVDVDGFAAIDAI